jgi:hypothetical protein
MKICNNVTETVGSEKNLWLVVDKVPSAGTSHLFSFVCFFLHVCVCVCVCVCARARVCVEVNSPKNMSFMFEGHNDDAEIVQQ